MRIFFIGSVEFSKRALLKLIDLNVNLVGVACKEQSVFNADFVDLGTVCSKYDIEYRYVKDINSEDVHSWIYSLKPDVIFCFGWSNLIKKKLLDIPPLGIIGFHPSNLPLNRGRHPIIWSLFLGLKQTASTFFFMYKGADSGDILSQEKIEINYDDDAKSLYEKITYTALRQIERILPSLENKSFKRMKQNEKVANYWRKRNKIDGKIDWRMSSRAIYNLVRALTHPYTGAHCLYEEQEVKIWKVRELNQYSFNIEPGKVLESMENSIIVKTYDNSAIEILGHEFRKIPKKGEYLKW